MICPPIDPEGVCSPKTAKEDFLKIVSNINDQAIESDCATEVQ